jgi:hypothetical protein
MTVWPTLPAFENLSRFVKSHGSVTAGTSSVGVGFYNLGDVTVGEGNLFLTGGWAGTKTFGGNPPTFVVSTLGDKIEFTGSYQFDPGVVLSGGGLVRFNGGSFQAGVPISAQNIELANGTLQVQAGLSNRPVNVDGNWSMAVSGRFTWTGGTMTGNDPRQLSEVLVGKGAGLSILFGAGKTLDLLLAVDGTAEWQADDIGLGSHARVYNAASATFTIACDQALGWNQANYGQFVNDGTVRKTAGQGTTYIGMMVTNSGLIEADAGKLLFAGDFFQGSSGICDLNGGAMQFLKSFFLPAGGTYRGVGTILGNLVSSGTISPGHSPGVITILGDFTQTGDGVLEMEWGGLTQGTQYDQLVVSNTATLGGTLRVSLLNGFLPNPGDRARLLMAGAGAGAFDRITGALPGGGRLLLPVYGSNGLELVATSIDPTHSGPALSSALSVSAGTTIAGIFTGAPNTQYRATLFAHTNCDLSGAAGDPVMIGTAKVATDASGNASFRVTAGAPLASGTFITAALTDTNNTTSAFAACTPTVSVSLSIAPVQQGYLLSWPKQAQGFRLQAASLNSPTLEWNDVPTTPQLVGDQFTVTVSTVEVTKWFRLVYP